MTGKVILLQAAIGYQLPAFIGKISRSSAEDIETAGSWWLL